MQDFKINQLKTFTTIVETGGFHAATEVLHKSQPAISLAIKSLEGNFGKPLFRKKSHAELTAFGHYFFKYAKSLIEHHEEIKLRLARDVEDDNLSVSIGTLPSVAQHLMPKYLKGFYAENPNARLHLRDTGSARLQELLSEHKIDIAISTIHDITGDFAIKQIAQDKMGVVCHQQHPVTKHKHIRWQDVAKHNPIANGTWDILPYQQSEALMQACRLNIANMSSLNAALSAGLGVTVLPELAFSENSGLAFLPLKQPTVYRQIGIIRDNHKVLSPMASRFFDYLTTR